MSEIEESVNIGKVLGQRLRAVGIDTREELQRLGDVEAFRRLVARFPDDACVSSRLAIAGAVRGVRWHDLDKDLRAELSKNLRG